MMKSYNMLLKLVGILPGIRFVAYTVQTSKT